MKKWIVLFSVVTAMHAVATPVLEHSVIKRAMAWMHEHPVMGPAGRSVASVEVFPESGQHFVYVVHLSPKGYLILNPNENPSLVASFSPDASVDLSDDPHNAFRSMLLHYVDRMERQPAQVRTVLAQPSSSFEAMTEVHGPFLDTTWNQGHPYNKMCPMVPDGLNGLNDRAPTGCVATAYAQLLQFHRWPLFGKGAHSYADTSGSVTGTHHADFSDTYDWASMLTSYAVFNPNPAEAEDAVAELMLELGIAVEANYEAGNTTASTWTLGNRLSEYFFFEPIEYHAWQADLTASMERDLREGFPCVVSIPGHSVVVDGLMVDHGVTTYHINFGWGGKNNGWWTADDAAGSPVESGVTSLKPRLMAMPQFPEVRSTLGEPVDLRWLLPRQREREAAQLNIHRLEPQAGFWQSDASNIAAGTTSHWDVVSEGHRGDCWFAGPNGPAWMMLDEVFVPDASTDLTFWLSRRLGMATFSVEVLADNGRTRTEIYSDNNHYSLAWEHKALSLAPFAGQRISLRFALTSGSYYQDTGGVWVDEAAVTSGDWFAWEYVTTDTTLTSERFSQVTTQWDDCHDFSRFNVNSTQGDNKQWRVTEVNDVGHCFYIIPDGRDNTTDHITSRSPITPTSSTRLLLRTKYKLGSDVFRVLLSADGVEFSEAWAGAGEVDWRDVAIDLSAYAGQPVYIRLEYVAGNYHPDGIWVDSISTQEVTHLELEGQPVTITTLTGLPAGTHTLAATLVDANAVEHGVGPSVMLTVSN